MKVACQSQLLSRVVMAVTYMHIIHLIMIEIFPGTNRKYWVLMVKSLGLEEQLSSICQY